ncbi:MAG: protein-disulfide reductase DsbD family protein [bacterium]|nr:protein-disulfide reductase DsbD family protein [bacterium]
MLQESFHIDPERGPVQTLETEHIKATASLSSGTVRRGQVHTLSLELELKPGLHIYGQPLPEGYIPTTLTFEAIEDVRFGEVQYPEPASLHLKALNETLPVYEGRVPLKTTLQNRRRDDFTVRARLDYQACDDRTCYPPADLTFELPLTYLDNA